MNKETVKDAKSKVNGEDSKNTETHATSSGDAPNITNDNDIKQSSKDSDSVVTAKVETDRDSQNGLTSPPSDEKPADIVTSSVEDEAIPVA